MYAIGFDPRNTAMYGVGAVMEECYLTQDANQYKMPKCVVVMACPSTSTTAAPRCTSSRTASSSGPRPGIFKE